MGTAIATGRLMPTATAYATMWTIAWARWMPWHLQRTCETDDDGDGICDDNGGDACDGDFDVRRLQRQGRSCLRML